MELKYSELVAWAKANPDEWARIIGMVNGGHVPRYVKMIAAAYGWTCLDCEEYNQETEWREALTCRWCGHKFMAMPPEHAYE